jgi:hypothetical protein
MTCSRICQNAGVPARILANAATPHRRVSIRLENEPPTRLTYYFSQGIAV